LVTLTAQQQTTLDAMRVTIDRFRRNGTSEQKIRKHVEAWTRAYPDDIRRYMEIALLEPWRLNILEDDRCPKCDDQAYLTTLYGRPMRCMEGRYGGMYEVHCPGCGWRGHAPVEVARRLPKRAMFARSRSR